MIRQVIKIFNINFGPQYSTAAHGVLYLIFKLNGKVVKFITLYNIRLLNCYIEKLIEYKKNNKNLLSLNYTMLIFIIGTVDTFEYSDAFFLCNYPVIKIIVILVIISFIPFLVYSLIISLYIIIIYIIKTIVIY